MLAGDEAEFLADHRIYIVGVRLGQLELAGAAAGAGAEQAARGERAQGAVGLVGVGVARASEQEGVDPGRRHRVEEISGDHARDRAQPQEGQHPHRHAGKGEKHHPGSSEDNGLTEIGLLHQQHRDDSEQEPGQRHHGKALILFPKREQPGDADNEERLQEFGWLELGEADADPALGTVHFVAEQGHEDEKDGEEGGAAEAQPPRQRLRQHRNRDHHRHSQDDPHQLAVEIIKRREADFAARVTLACCGRCRRDGDEADRDQDRDEEEENPVDLPEPAPDRASVRAAELRRRSLLGPRDRPDIPLPHVHCNASTAARNASPRAS
jgi:hypothetical protein